MNRAAKIPKYDSTSDSQGPWLLPNISVWPLNCPAQLSLVSYCSHVTGTNWISLPYFEASKNNAHQMYNKTHKTPHQNIVFKNIFNIEFKKDQKEL